MTILSDERVPLVVIIFCNPAHAFLFLFPPLLVLTRHHGTSDHRPIFSTSSCRATSRYAH